MSITRFSSVGAFVFPILFATAASAMNVNYNFQQDNGGWTVETLGTVEQPWTYSDTGSDKGWAAFRGADSTGSGSYLVSPVLSLDPPSGKPRQYVSVRIKHFFNFGGSAAGGSPWSLGQAQYRYAGGEWEGIGTADFDSTSKEHYAPSYSSPPAPFISSTNIPTAATPVEAWEGTTNGFANGTHRDSYFQLDYPPLGDYPFMPGQSIQFRLLAGTLDPLPAGRPELIWDITAVEVFHVSEVPEPGTLALAATGLLTGGFGLLRRRIKRPIVFTVLLIFCVFGGQRRGMSLDITYDFADGPQGWVSQTVAADGGSYPESAWGWSGGLWQVDPVPVLNSRYWISNTLTSPQITVEPATDVLEFTIIHRYRFPTNITTGGPVVAGQLAYRVGGAPGPFLPLLPDTFTSGPVDPQYQPLTPYPTWVGTTSIAPASLNPPLLTTGGIWTGESPGFASGQFVASQTLLRGLLPGEEVEFRFINANLGLECTGGGWDIAYVDIVGLELPEPTSLTMAATGCGLAALGWLRRRQHLRPHGSTPEVTG